MRRITQLDDRIHSIIGDVTLSDALEDVLLLSDMHKDPEAVV